MKLHFKAKNFASIVRQLNSYGFQATILRDRKQVFNHPFFIRDSPQELSRIQRIPKREKAGPDAAILETRQNEVFKETDGAQEIQSSLHIGSQKSESSESSSESESEQTSGPAGTQSSQISQIMASRPQMIIRIPIDKDMRMHEEHNDTYDGQKQAKNYGWPKPQGEMSRDIAE